MAEYWAATVPLGLGDKNKGAGGAPMATAKAGMYGGP